MKSRVFLTTLILPLVLAARGGTSSEPTSEGPQTTDCCFNPEGGVLQCFYILMIIEGQALPYESLP